ncbi:MAG: S-layer homology domain-containing protein [Coleofasciculus sp. S288]|nr:S-layer homology domain-containing protein [Coleofasciculus sp. S288]
MTNLPPDRRDPRLGFDELVGVVVAFAAIGTILFVSMREKEGGFKFGNWFPVLTAPLASPEPTISPVPPEALPTQVEEEKTPFPQLRAPAPVTPASPITPVARERERESQVTPIAPAALIPVSPTPISPTPAKTVNFSDVPQDFWARPYIEALAGRGIIVGFEDNTFRPNQPVTRAEFAAQLTQAFDQKAVAQAQNYNDVASNFWAASAIREVTQSGFLKGYPGNVFQPTQQIPRVQALVALTSGLRLVPTSTPVEVVQVYQDANQIPNYATQAVAAATERGLVVNYPNPKLLRPNQDATRAEVAAMVYQAMVQAGRVEPIPSQYVVNQ